MSVGQVLGTLSFVAFLSVVVTDLQSRYRAVNAKGGDSTKARARVDRLAFPSRHP